MFFSLAALLLTFITRPHQVLDHQSGLNNYNPLFGIEEERIKPFKASMQYLLGQCVFNDELRLLTSSYNSISCRQVPRAQGRINGG